MSNIVGFSQRFAYTFPSFLIFLLVFQFFPLLSSDYSFFSQFSFRNYRRFFFLFFFLNTWIQMNAFKQKPHNPDVFSGVNSSGSWIVERVSIYLQGLILTLFFLCTPVKLCGLLINTELVSLQKPAEENPAAFEQH